MKLIFELYSSGRYSVDGLRKEIIEQAGERISKANLHRILKSRFYLGFFTWRGREYQGIHPPLVDSVTFGRVQDLVTGRSKAKPHKHVFPFSNILHCADDGCAITAERHKEKYVYYRCTFGRGKHAFPYMPEQKVADMLGMALERIHIPAEIARAIANSTHRDRGGDEAKRQREISKLNQRISALQTRTRKAYEDKLDAIIDDEFWLANMERWSAQEQQLKTALERASEPIPEIHGLSVPRIMELAKRARSIYATGDFADRAHLLKLALLNCATDGVNAYPTYRQPFNLIFGNIEG